MAGSEGKLAILSMKTWSWKSLGLRLRGVHYSHVAQLAHDKIYYFNEDRRRGNYPLIEFDIVQGKSRELELSDKGAMKYWRKTCVFAACRNEIIAFGGVFGLPSQARITNDTHAFNLDTKTWRKLELRGRPPHPRKRHLAIMHGSKMCIHGGYAETDQIFNDIWIAELSQASAPFWSFLRVRKGGTPLRRFRLLNDLNGMFIIYGLPGKREMHIFSFEEKRWRCMSCSKKVVKVEGKAPTNKKYSIRSVATTNGVIYIAFNGIYRLSQQEWC